MNASGSKGGKKKFKSLDYSGFDSLQELKTRAEQLTTVLANEIHKWHQDVEVRWSPDPTTSKQILNLTLSLTLPNGLSESPLGQFRPIDWTEDWRLRSRCRGIWSNLLGKLLKKQYERVKESLLEPDEV